MPVPGDDDLGGAGHGRGDDVIVIGIGGHCARRAGRPYTLIAGAVGGVTSAVAGGDFTEGAVTGAFGYLFNECAHTRMCGSDSTTSVGATVNPAGGIAGVLYTEPTSLHFGFVINDGYGSQRIDGLPSCFIPGCGPTLVAKFGSVSNRNILDSLQFMPLDGVGLGDLANTMRSNALVLSGSVSYSYPRFGSGQMEAFEYNSNSMANSIYFYSTGKLLRIGHGAPYIAPGINNIIPKP